ncbi:MAG: amidohydrolase [Saprospiraceae bacterium]|nr:amidohydrolase [Saprospiraceae bacterium]
MQKFILHPLLFAFILIQPMLAQDFIEKESRLILDDLIQHRRHLHQNPELSNREFNTAQYVAKHLREYNLEVKEGIAHTGVVGILKTNRPGPVIALRADMDALPVEEKSGLPFASQLKTNYNGQEVSVSHACGHDAHVAILLGTAQLLAKHRHRLKGTIVFIFQPAEEGPPEGEEGGAPMMIQQGVLEDPKVEVIFGLHMNAHAPVGHLWYKPGAFMASADWFKVEITGKQTHGAKPWDGVDPITVAAQIIQGYQTIVARQTDLTKTPLVLTVGKINGGLRENIIPEKVIFGGSIRVMDTSIQYQTHRSMHLMTKNIAEAYGANASLTIVQRCPVTFNTPDLVQRMIPSLQKAAGADRVSLTDGSTWSEDFAWYGTKVPSFFFNLGGRPVGIDPDKVSPHHTPGFVIDDSQLDVGVRAFCHLVMDYSR